MTIIEPTWCIINNISHDIFENVFDMTHDDVIKWKRYPRHWPFVRGINRSGEFPAQRPVTRNFDVFFDLRFEQTVE